MKQLDSVNSRFTGSRKLKHSTLQKVSARTLRQGSVGLKVHCWTYFIDFRDWWITQVFKKEEKEAFKHRWVEKLHVRVEPWADYGSK